MTALLDYANGKMMLMRWDDIEWPKWENELLFTTDHIVKMQFVICD